jgi:hypothetical protein
MRLLQRRFYFANSLTTMALAAGTFTTEESSGVHFPFQLPSF